MMRDLIARPSQLSPLARIAVDAFRRAPRCRRVRRHLGPHFALAITLKVTATWHRRLLRAALAGRGGCTTF